MTSLFVRWALPALALAGEGEMDMSYNPVDFLNSISGGAPAASPAAR